MSLSIIIGIPPYEHIKSEKKLPKKPAPPVIIIICLFKFIFLIYEVWPPSITTFAPVVKEEISDDKKRTKSDIFLVVPNFFKGTLSLIYFFTFYLLDLIFLSQVLPLKIIFPGDIALILILSLDNILDWFLTKAIKAALETE